MSIYKNQGFFSLPLCSVHPCIQIKMIQNVGNLSSISITLLCRRILISVISISRLPWISQSQLGVPATASLCNAGGLNIKKYWIILKVLEFVVMRLDCTKYFLINKAFCKTLMQVHYMYVGDIRDLWCSGFASGCWLESKKNHINII